MDFLITTKSDMERRGVSRLDFIMISGDAYVDHSSFGPALICRLLEREGYSVGIIAQPDIKNDAAFRELGEPRLAFLVSSGNIDSMVNHYTVAKKRRSEDSFSPGGKAGKRPDRALIVYGNILKRLFGGVPVIAGGIEASLRRLSHYDYWSDKLRRSVLLDSGCDMIVYGMGEHQILAVAEGLAGGAKISEITSIPGTVFKAKDAAALGGCIILPSHEDMLRDKLLYAESFRIQYENTDALTAKRLAEPVSGALVVQNPPMPTLSEKEMDRVYSLRFMNAPHPSYSEAGGIPAISEVKFSLLSCRGCFGSCNFCALSFHQGRTVTSRSHKSILLEAENLTREPDFKGYIHDVGGPSANFRHASCEKQKKDGLCRNKKCLFPKPCANINASHADYIALLEKLRVLPGIKKVFIRSGIRYDYLLADKNGGFLRQLVKHHVSGQLKIAPEHVSAEVLRLMGKPGSDVFERFVRLYKDENAKLGMKQFLVPYLMSSHPGSTIHSAIELAEYLRDNGMRPEQVQDFYPTPSTVSTCMYYTGIDPLTGKEVYVARDYNEKAMQRALIQYYLPQNKRLVRQALKSAGREDLIGFGLKCLIRPEQFERPVERNSKKAGKPFDRKPADKAKAYKKKTIRNVHKKKS